MRCQCGSLDCDIDWGQCFECFCADRAPEQYPAPTPTEADYCASGGHGEYECMGHCYCGEQLYLPANQHGKEIYARLAQA